jgi:acetolactate synthase-1/2/3 large subunit
MLAMSAHANDWTDDDLAGHRDGFNVALRPKVENFSPHEALDVVRAVVPRDGIITYDVGAHTHQIASQWVTHAPRACHVTNGWSSMGIGIPRARACRWFASSATVAFR